jgi:D-alanine-D-alanine ligase-like ATP-grasp enzyme
MQKINIKRTKNIWVPLQGNFCTPFAVWELDLAQIEELISIEVREKILRCLVKPTELKYGLSAGIMDLLTLTAAKLQSCDSDEVLAWLVDVSSKHSDKRFCYPFLDEKVAAQVGPLAINFLLKTNVIYENTKEYDVALAKALELFKMQRMMIDNLIPSASSLRVLVEAKKRLIPTRRHSDRPSYQLGYGFHRTLIYKGYTNYTSQLATTIATHKPITVSVLKESGLPAPKHFIVRSFEEATTAADRLGFPVVVKPTSTDKGVGVSVDVKNCSELELAWSHASRYGTVLIEEMLQGFDHRLHVVNGKCEYVVRRTPPYIVGNGVSTIENLIAGYAQNRSLNGEYRNFPNAQVTDLAVLEHLKKQGLSTDSVLMRDQFVYLRTNANVSTGGFADEVSEQCHRDNRLLAERAARLIGLDNAGIDFITTDITTSWISSGGKITEVNPTPAFGKDIAFKAYLDYLHPNKSKGQIPIILFVGHSDSLESHLSTTIKKYSDSKNCFAYISNRVLYICSEKKTSRTPGEKTQDLLIGMLGDPLIEAAIIQVNFKELELGFELHYFTMIVAVGDDREMALLLQSDVISRCETETLLINPALDDYRASLESLLLG